MAFEPRTDELPDELGENIAAENRDHDRLAARQRSPRNDPSMRDGDGSMGNVNESNPGVLGTDNDTGDAEDEPVSAGFDGGANEGTPAELRADANSNADDFTLGAREEPADADALDDERGDLDAEDRTEDDAAPAVTDPLPHPRVAAGRDGSTVGENEPVRRPRLHIPSAPADEGTAAVDLPIDRYSELTVAEIAKQAGSLSPDQVRQVRDFEVAHRNRKTLVTKLDRLLAGRRRGKRTATAE